MQTTNQLLATNLELLTAHNADTTEFLKRTPAEAQVFIDELTNKQQPTDLNMPKDLFDAGKQEQEERSEPLGVMPAKADYANNQDYLEATVEWLLHEDQLPVIITNTVEVGGKSLELNGHKLNTEFSLTSKDAKSGKVFYRIPAITLCCIVINNGADKVNGASEVATDISTAWGGNSNLDGFTMKL